MAPSQTRRACRPGSGAADGVGPSFSSGASRDAATPDLKVGPLPTEATCRPGFSSQLPDPRVPVVEVEGVVRQIGWRGQEAIGADHQLDVIENGPRARAYSLVEPDRAPIEDETRNVRDGARPEATGFGEVDDFSKLAAQPLLFECVRGTGARASVRNNIH